MSHIAQIEIEMLSDRLAKAIPKDPQDDGTFGTDGSTEALLGVFERAFNRVAAVAEDAIKMLKDKEKS